MKLKLVLLGSGLLALHSCGTQNVTTKTPVKETSKSVVLTKELEEGRTTYENNCAKCHKLYEANEFSKSDWKPILVRMQKKAKVNDAQIASISDYIYWQL